MGGNWSVAKGPHRKDTAIHKDKGWVGIGVLLRDHTGKMIMAKSLTWKGYLGPTEVEALAAVTATQTCRSWGIDRALFVGDAKGVVDAINNGEARSSLRNPILQDLYTYLHDFSEWKIAHGSRIMNKPAHELTRMSMAREMDEMWFVVPPDGIQNLLGLEEPVFTI
jgi:ribonuclease HI